MGKPIEKISVNNWERMWACQQTWEVAQTYCKPEKEAREPPPLFLMSVNRDVDHSDKNQFAFEKETSGSQIYFSLSCTMNKAILTPLHSLNYFLKCSWALELSDPNFKITLGVGRSWQCTVKHFIT
jgi:hypothetical protein